MKRSLLALACGLLLSGLVASCGGDDEKAPETVPTVTTETETTPTETTPTATTPPPAATTPAPTTPAPPPDTDSGGTPAPRTTTQPQDGPYNDVPPEPGSPAERFERACEQNPQTCGD